MQCKHLPPSLLVLSFCLDSFSDLTLSNLWVAQSFGHKNPWEVFPTKKKRRRNLSFFFRRNLRRNLRRRKYRECSHELALGWRGVQPRWSVQGAWRSSLGPRGMVSPISPVPACNNSDEVTTQQLFGMSSYRKLCRWTQSWTLPAQAILYLCNSDPASLSFPFPKVVILSSLPQNQEQKQRAQSSHGLIIFVDESSKQTRDSRPVEPTQRESSLPWSFNDSLD